MPNTPSYHDLHIECDGLPRTSIFNLPYNVSVHCTRTGGWEVWHRPDDRGEQKVLAGEYHMRGLRLDVAGHVIVDSLTDQMERRADYSEEYVAKCLDDTT
jgi:hypothetical protein